MSHQQLVLALGAMSVVVAVEAFWLSNTIITEERLRQLTQKPATSALKTIYFLAFPYVALTGGLIPERLFGLKGLEYFTWSQNPFHTLAALPVGAGFALHTWLPDFGPAALFGLLGGLLWVAYLWIYSRSISGLAVIPLPGLSKTEAGFDVIHWSFYRAVLWLVTDSLYLGVIGGIAVILVEYAAISRVGRFSAQTQARYLLKFGAGLLTSLVFLFAPNLWLITLIHLALVWAGNSVLKNRRKAAVSPPVNSLEDLPV